MRTLPKFLSVNHKETPWKKTKKQSEFIFKHRSQTRPEPTPPTSLTIWGEKVHMVADGLLHGAFKSLVGGSDG